MMRKKIMLGLFCSLFLPCFQPSKRNPAELVGRNDGGTRVILSNNKETLLAQDKAITFSGNIKPGDYVAVDVS